LKSSPTSEFCTQYTVHLHKTASVALMTINTDQMKKDHYAAYRFCNVSSSHSSGCCVRRMKAIREEKRVRREVRALTSTRGNKEQNKNPVRRITEATWRDKSGNSQDECMFTISIHP
jgi:hypothetical protein